MSKSPTDSELAILQVLWAQGPSTVREVHESLRRDERLAYTTTLKTMQNMHDKGLVARDASRRSHVYRPAVAQQAVETSLVGELLTRVFGGSSSQLMVRALAAKKADAEELEEIRALIDREESGRGVDR